MKSKELLLKALEASVEEKNANARKSIIAALNRSGYNSREIREQIREITREDPVEVGSRATRLDFSKKKKSHQAKDAADNLDKIQEVLNKIPEKTIEQKAEELLDMDLDQLDAEFGGRENMLGYMKDVFDYQLRKKRGKDEYPEGQDLLDSIHRKLSKIAS